MEDAVVMLLQSEDADVMLPPGSKCSGTGVKPP
jgi:hypothetical protein